VLGHAAPPVIKLGRQHARIHGARVFVLPNPSGRNANFSYAEMLEAFRSLRRAAQRQRSDTVSDLSTRRAVE
jgi:G:T/U-mismatch repair DNA glycosylase